MKKTAKQIQKDLFTKEFKQYFNKKIRPHLQIIEKQRIIHVIVFCLVIVLIIITIVIYPHIPFCQNKDGIVNLRGLLVITTVEIALAEFVRKHYTNYAKKLCFVPLLSFIGDIQIISSETNKNMMDKYISKLRLLPKHDIFFCDDFLCGEYKNINVEIAEVDLRKDTKRSKNRYVQVFNGLFIKFKSFKNFKGYTIIKGDKLKIGDNSKYVRLEDPEFEKIYDVYGSDQIEARYLLTTGFMNRLVKLSKKEIGKSLTVSFEHGNVNIAIASTKDWFEVPLFHDATDIVNYRGILLELMDIFSIIDILKLEQNIGM